MSAYSDYKCGAISEDEFKSSMRRECEDVDWYDRYTCNDCASHRDCEKLVIEQGYPQCDDKDDYFQDELVVYEAMQDKEFLKKTYGNTDVEFILKKNYQFDIIADYEKWKENQ